MASTSQDVLVGRASAFAGRNGLLDRYFYFGMSLVFAAIVWRVQSHGRPESVPCGSSTALAFVDSWRGILGMGGLLHLSGDAGAHAQREVAPLLWLVRGGPCGNYGSAGLYCRGHHDALRYARPARDRRRDLPQHSFLRHGRLCHTRFAGHLLAQKARLHRRLLFLATCSLLDAPFGRFDVIFNNGLFFPCLDAVILLGVARDLIVNRRIHAVYRYALPLLLVAQSLTMYLWKGSPGWWLRFTRSILG